MSLFTMDLDQLMFSDVENFCVDKMAENVRLDYKKQLSATNRRAKLIKPVSSFANTQGGILVFGVETKRDSKIPITPICGMPADKDFSKRVQRLCIEHISPPVITIVGYADDPKNPNRAVAVVRTEASWFTPHTVAGGTIAYVRRVDNSDPVRATIQELELLGNRRRLAIERREREISDLDSRLFIQQGRNNRSMALFIVPELLDETAIPWSELQQTCRDLRDTGLQAKLTEQATSYSRGLMSRNVNGWGFGLTVTGSLALYFNHGGAGREHNEPVNLEVLLGWALLAVRISACLSRAAKYWGNYVIRFYAFRHEGLEVTHPDFGPRELKKVLDENIEIHHTWTALEARKAECETASILFERMMWCFGQHHRIWSDCEIIGRLRKVAAWIA